MAYEPLFVFDALEDSVQEVRREARLLFDQLHEFFAFVRKYPQAPLQHHETGALEDPAHLRPQRCVFLRNVECGDTPLVVPPGRGELRARFPEHGTEDLLAALRYREALAASADEPFPSEPLDCPLASVSVVGPLIREAHHPLRRSCRKEESIQEISGGELLEQVALDRSELAHAAFRHIYNSSMSGRDGEGDRCGRHFV